MFSFLHYGTPCQPPLGDFAPHLELKDADRLPGIAIEVVWHHQFGTQTTMVHPFGAIRRIQ